MVHIGLELNKSVPIVGGVFASIVTEVSASQLENASSPILVTLSGMVMEVSASQLENA